ncbi:EamA family transporter [Elizabethkingia argentiflava]|uniref:EamA family transporter n=1 Tax=Elizabethkingia argenteiflava TaxID=2681556 RepID=A0A845Q1D3_9FLAO|nr:DMT family transporter [Elizabethkingia argenteiflava]NAW52140.1 EamA family transporter [Elizabethkingia argenteiflava]
MQKKNILKGVLFVGLGAGIYGMLATFVKLAYHNGYTTAEITTSQFVWGIIGLFILNLIQGLFQKTPAEKAQKKDLKKLLLAGTSLGCTSLFYYLSVQYINVSIAIVLLMQSVWFSVVVESVLNKKLPGLGKVMAVIMVLIGTVLATNLINMEIKLDIRGIVWGLLAAVSYTVTMFTSNTIATYLPVFRKSLIQLLGGSIIILIFLLFSQIGPYYSEVLKNFYLHFSHNLEGVHDFNFSILWTYGLFLAIFGTIVPPIFFNLGFPNAGLGLGSIVSSLELPISVGMAFIILGEKVAFIQWLGIVLILLAIVLMNLPALLKKK